MSDHKDILQKLTFAGLSREDALKVVGIVCDLRDTAYQQGFSKGYNEGYKEGKEC